MIATVYFRFHLNSPGSNNKSHHLNQSPCVHGQSGLTLVFLWCPSLERTAQAGASGGSSALFSITMAAEDRIGLLKAQDRFVGFDGSS